MPSLRNAGFNVAIFARSHGERRLVLVDHDLALAALHGDRRDLRRRTRRTSTAFSARCVDSVANASCSARENVYFCAVASAKAPMSLPVERALQAVVEHVVQQLAVAHAHAAARALGSR